MKSFIAASLLVAGVIAAPQHQHFGGRPGGPGNKETSTATSATTSAASIATSATSVASSVATSVATVASSATSSAASTVATTVATTSTTDSSTETCDQWGTVTTGTYIIYQDLWDEAAATSGSQCTTVDSLSGTTVEWSTSWSWEGASSSVKSYANAALTFDATELSAISTIDTTWTWSYTGSDIVADVSYDMFTASSATGTTEFEIMVWLDALGGAGPISSTGSTIATPTIGSYTWDLYSGPNGDTTVYSFVATSAIEDFSGDLKAFFTYLIDNEGFSSSQYINTIEAGTEPFTGSDAVFTTSAYSAVIA